MSAVNSWWSWIIAAACCLVYCLLVTVYRSSALFYSALIEQYNMDRETASIPFVVLALVRCLSGLIFGVLGERFGSQRVVFFGCYMCVLGVGTSYFAQSVVTLSFTLGILYGFGMTATALLPNIIREYFDDTTTSISNGVINMGPCLAAVAFSALIIHIIDAYGVSGSLLLSSGIILNSLPLIMILKPNNKQSDSHKESNEIQSFRMHVNRDKDTEVKEIDIVNTPLYNTGNQPNKIITRECEDANEPKYELGEKHGIVKITSSFVKKGITKCSLHGKECCPCINTFLEDNTSNQDSTEKNIVNLVRHPEVNYTLISTNLSSQPKYEQVKLSEEIYFDFQKSVEDCQQYNVKSYLNIPMAVKKVEQSKGFFYTLNVLKDPTFMALTLVQGLLAYTFNVWLTTMIDYSRDKGIDRSDEIYILTLNPITDIIGRVGLAWVTDKGFLSVITFCALIYVLMGVASIWIALAQSFLMMCSGIMLMTLGIGVMLSIYPTMSYAYIEKDKQAVSIASIGLLYAPLSFTVSPLIGYFRGNSGSYDGLYYILAVMNFACSLIVLLLPKLANIRERNKIKKLYNVSEFEIS